MYNTLAVDLGAPYYVYQIYLQAQGLWDLVGYVTDQNTFGVDTAFNGVSTTRCSGMNHVNVSNSSIFGCALAGRHFTLIRQTDTLFLEQLVVLGWRCDEKPVVAT